MKGQIRIIAGKYKGRKINFPESLGLRPTTDRVKETVFNWLMHDIRDAHCLDLFAGSGSLGLEALSRAAATVTFIEKASKVARQLHLTLEQLGADNAVIQQTDGLQFLQQTQQRFDVIFLDPPFGQGLTGQCLELIQQHKLLNPDGLIYLESEHFDESKLQHWTVLKHKKAGQAHYALLYEN